MRTCTWLFQKPAVTTRPLQSITVPCRGILVVAVGPTARIWPWCIRIEPYSIGGSAGGWINPCSNQGQVRGKARAARKYASPEKRQSKSDSHTTIYGPIRTLATALVGCGKTGTTPSFGVNEGALKVAIHRLRRRFRAVIKNEIIQTLPDEAQVDEEMSYLLQALV